MCPVIVYTLLQAVSKVHYTRHTHMQHRNYVKKVTITKSLQGVDAFLKSCTVLI